MASSLAPEEGEPASPCSAAGTGRTVASPVRDTHRGVATGTSRRRRQKKRNVPASATLEVHGRARYDSAFREEPPVEEGGFAPPRLVWAKVLGHPWWPGQVFHPSDASALALREKKRRDAVLVACFGDRSFVWAGADDLLPFRDGFPLHADKTNKFAFSYAMSDALDEVARRVDAGLSCGCGDARDVKQVFVNDGLRKGARGADAVDAAFAREAFRQDAFVGYVRALALAPQAGADGLDLAVATAQLKAFTRWRSFVNPEQLDSTASVEEDKAFKVMLPGEAREEYASAMAVTSPDGAGAELRHLAASNTEEWRGPPTMDVVDNGATEAATQPPACRGTTKKTRSTGGEDADSDANADHGIFTASYTMAGEDSASDDGWETESEDFEVSSDWELGWKDYVIIIQFMAILMLVFLQMH